MTKIKLGQEVFIVDFNRLSKESEKAKVKDIINKGYVAGITTLVTSIKDFEGEVTGKIFKQAKNGVENAKKESYYVVTEKKYMTKVDSDEIFLSESDAKKYVVQNNKKILNAVEKIIKNFK